MRIFVLLCLISLALSAKSITPNEVFSEVALIHDEIHYLLKHYGVKHDHKKIIMDTKIDAKVKPRNVWQKSYEILVKINMLRVSHHLSRIEPVGMEPVIYLNPDMTYEQTQRILTEIRIFKTRMGIKNLPYKHQTFKNKTPQDVFNELSHISASFDELNKTEFSHSYVFSETMRIYNDLSSILQHIKIKDNTIPSKRDPNATPLHITHKIVKILDKIKYLQRSVGIETVDFSAFFKANPTPSDVFTLTQMILAELQTIKAYIGLTNYVTEAALTYSNKSSVDVDQLMSWNLRKILLIESIIGKNDEI